MTSALRSARLTTTSVPNPGQQRRPPEVRPTAFTARPPDLPPRPLMTVDFAITCSLVRPGRPRYPVLVHRAAALLHASFGPRLAATPLRFANPSPPSGWIEDFHLQAVDHARHTRKTPGGWPGAANFVKLDVYFAMASTALINWVAAIWSQSRSFHFLVPQ